MNKPNDDATPSPEDITRRLRRWTFTVDAEPASDLMEQAAEEIENLRKAIRRLADQDVTLSVARAGGRRYNVGRKETAHGSENSDLR